MNTMRLSQEERRQLAALESYVTQELNQIEEVVFALDQMKKLNPARHAELYAQLVDKCRQNVIRQGGTAAQADEMRAMLETIVRGRQSARN